jgi:translocation and assembly module TamA
MSRQSLPLLLLAVMLALALAVTARADDLPYSTYIDLRGLDDAKLVDSLRGVSQLVALENRPPPSETALRRRAEDDLPRLKEVMQAAGYWTPQLSYALDLDSKPARLTVTIEPGPRFHLASVDFRTSSGETPLLLEQLGPAGLGLVVGGPALSAPVAEAEMKIVEAYGRNGHPFAQVTNRKAVVDIATDAMTVTYTVEPGPEARFGALTIEGLSEVDPYFVRQRVAWHEGTPYDSGAVETTRQRLVKTALFSAVRISHGEAPDAAGEVPMTISLVEGPPRSVGAGVAYNTNLGFGGQAFWQHRNLFGEGESLRLNGVLATKLEGAALSFRKPDFIDSDQDFLTDAAFLKQITDAYHSLRGQIFFGIERPLSPTLTFRTGISAEHVNLEQSVSGSEIYSMLGVPSFLRRDTSNDLLNPTTGSRQTLTLIPYQSISGPQLTFLTSRIEDRHYLSLDEAGNTVLAGYAALGSIVGAGRDALPADKRLYAGGAGSVRGYGYQLAGPLSPSNKPLGGVSSLEFGAEFRYRITDTIGLVPFFDAGNVYPTSLPDSTKLFYSAGIGLRYYTAIGPARLDLAFPIERRPIDSPVQVYISIGQAF